MPLLLMIYSGIKWLRSIINSSFMIFTVILFLDRCCSTERPATTGPRQNPTLGFSTPTLLRNPTYIQRAPPSELLFLRLPIMSASARIPPIAQPFVSDRAKKTLDLVCSRPNRSSRIVHSDITPCHPAPSSLLTTSLFFRGNRSRNSSRKTASPPTPSSPPSSARARSDGRPPPS